MIAYRMSVRVGTKRVAVVKQVTEELAADHGCEEYVKRMMRAELAEAIMTHLEINEAVKFQTQDLSMWPLTKP